MDFAADVRTGDRTQYLATLFAPESARPALYALAAYRLELARIVARARDPLAAEVRLQWWRDAIRNEGFGEGAPVPLVLALRDGMARYGWPAETLAAMSEARIHDLYADPFEDTDGFDGFAGEAFAAPLQLAAMAHAIAHHGEEAGFAAARTAAGAAGHGGVALAAADAALGEAQRLGAGRTHIPATLWQAAGVANIAAHIEAGTVPDALPAAVRAIVDHGEAADAAFRGALKGADPAVRAALLPAFTARPALAAARKRPAAPRMPGPLGVQWTLWRAARRLGPGA
ncbi:squalene/phytoene synthase family protein [Acuticoccus sp. MNP-M23]|uniref:squalene/phytoene synthase family protein n=1 Tax=Acuticoccus sp. MNP-M23 TaxID=3072793 RepID=UPI00281561E3|nr:squalene/phytoene synthase family protein [Acuticoccus sp. MNP-M23]WMS42406.1 squalene/phytoene synthase family protein [Acuticoccus sp. MNP-M23]